MTSGYELPKIAQAPPARDDDNLVNSMKALRRKRLHRQAFADPSMHRELVKIESSPVYNASAELIQAVSSSRGSA
ncbi:hypothetical protein [Maridesulfovibrio hydrothermalis]|uniref:Uncharacterized protein n=1 Tax=Maridesulfovibrio hydrothermalis AM13 = DSM 14728 TaxID=1121451 RepID=L0R738_9BACT|nr:hypothetical protein [Maridesulfovibrio hydrothermalis]CCO22554.1 conserved protein of unknown function [Maridesulfovibrio hydrothermalis AM13 = DSM 14728]